MYAIQFLKTIDKNTPDGIGLLKQLRKVPAVLRQGNSGKLFFEIKDDFLFKCGIRGGDIVAVEQHKDIRFGDFVVLRHDGKFIIRLFTGFHALPDADKKGKEELLNDIVGAVCSIERFY